MEKVWFVPAAACRERLTKRDSMAIPIHCPIHYPGHVNKGFFLVLSILEFYYLKRGWFGILFARSKIFPTTNTPLNPKT